MIFLSVIHTKRQRLTSDRVRAARNRFDWDSNHSTQTVQIWLITKHGVVPDRHCQLHGLQENQQTFVVVSRTRNILRGKLTAHPKRYQKEKKLPGKQIANCLSPFRKANPIESTFQQGTISKLELIQRKEFNMSDAAAFFAKKKKKKKTFKFNANTIDASQVTSTVHV